jgi:hypothetical protein
MAVADQAREVSRIEGRCGDRGQRSQRSPGPAAARMGFFNGLLGSLPSGTMAVAGRPLPASVVCRIKRDPDAFRSPPIPCIVLSIQVVPVPDGRDRAGCAGVGLP